VNIYCKGEVIGGYSGEC